MFNMSENSCYLTVIRPPQKSIQHCAQGSCEIERVSYLNDHKDLQYSIKHSKVLREYKQKFPYTSIFNSKQCEHLLSAKNIIDDKSKFYVEKTLKELHCTLFSIWYIEKLKKQKYNSTIPLHQKYLLEIWQNLKPDQKLEARVSDQWISIGFQVNDPATDFRGAGYLGLINLHRFTKTDRGYKAFKIASAPKTEYFFCSAGLFFTMLATELLKQRKIDYDHWVHNSQQELLDRFQIVYDMLFMQFTIYWLQFCKDKSILYFNQNLKNFEKHVKSWNNQMIKARIQDFYS